MSDITRRKLTIADIGRTRSRLPERTQLEPPKPAPVPATRPPAPPGRSRAVQDRGDVWPSETPRRAPPQPLPKAKAAKPPQPPPEPPRAPGGKTAAQRAKAKRHRVKWLRKHEPPQAELLATLSALATRYPRAFGASCIPLAIGIHTAILAETGIEPRLLGVALRRWCNRDVYLAAIASGTHRHDLTGAAAAELTEEERARAAERLDAMRAAMKAAKTRAEGA